MSNQIKTVALEVYRGERKFDENGKYIGEKQEVTFTYGDTEWAKHIGRLKNLGINSVEVVKAYGKGEWKGEGLDKKMVFPEIEVSDELKKEVQSLFNPQPKTELTPEQKEIAELKARLDALTKPDDKKTKETTDEEIESLRSDYLKKFNKAVPNNKKNDAEWIKEEISKKDAE